MENTSIFKTLFNNYFYCSNKLLTMFRKNDKINIEEAIYIYLFVGDKKEFMNGIKNRELSKVLDIHENYISSILCGKRKCSKLVAYAMARAVGKSGIKGYFIKK